ncbi:hypothetical protein [Aeromicrobium sp.]|nr:hypothetical protein [Aeromicrobium sp.]
MSSRSCWGRRQGSACRLVAIGLLIGLLAGFITDGILIAGGV